MAINNNLKTYPVNHYRLYNISSEYRQDYPASPLYILRLLLFLDFLYTMSDREDDFAYHVYICGYLLHVSAILYNTFPAYYLRNVPYQPAHA